MSLTTIMLTWIASVSSYLTVTSAGVFSQATLEIHQRIHLPCYGSVYP